MVEGNFLLVMLLLPVPIVAELVALIYLEIMIKNNVLIYKFAMIPIISFIIAGIMPHVDGIGETPI
jgi:hypothetical protein